jgi:preprotein translocase subunit YajC
MITQAYAAQPSAPASTGPGGIDVMLFLPPLLIIAIFYFLVIRPQNKRMKDHEELLKTIDKGDQVLLSGGMVGLVKKIDEGENKDYLMVEISEGVHVKILRNTIVKILNKKA